jgi:hypothetical protein
VFVKPIHFPDLLLPGSEPDTVVAVLQHAGLVLAVAAGHGSLLRLKLKPKVLYDSIEGLVVWLVAVLPLHVREVVQKRSKIKPGATLPENLVDSLENWIIL